MDDFHGIFVYVDIKKKTIFLYNSALNVGENKLVLDTILQYLQSEHSDKLKTELPDVGIWRQNATIAKPPQQSNWFDCGVFMCQFCKCLASGDDLSIINQKFVTRFARTSMANEIKAMQLED